MQAIYCICHQKPITRICMGSDCDNRLMCQQCEEKTQHRYHGRYIQFNLREAIRKIKYKYEQRCVNRLNFLVDYITKKFLSEISILRTNIENEIKLKCRTDFSGSNVLPQILGWMNQIQRNNYNGLSELQIDQVRHTLLQAEKNTGDGQLCQKQHEQLNVIACRAFKEVRLAEKVYWSQSDKSKDTMSNSWTNLFKSLVLEHQTTIDRYRQEFDTLSKSVNQISKSISTTNTDKKLALNLKKSSSKEMFSEIIRSEKIEWQTLTELAMPSNKITHIDPFIYLRAEALRKINLSHNEIHSIEALLQIKLPNLQDLNLDTNRLETIEPFCRANWPKLKTLNLSNNCLNNVNNIVGFKFPCLHSLFLNNNHITSFKPFIEVVWPKLAHIYVKGIMLQASESLDNIKFKDGTLRAKFWSIF